MIRWMTALGFVLGLAFAGCDGNGSGRGSPPSEDHPPNSSSSSGSTVTSGSPETTTAVQPGSGSDDSKCRPSTSRTAQGGEPLGDVDGDGEVDQVYLYEGNLGVETSSGVVAEIPTGRARLSKVIGVADANADGRGEIFVVGVGASASEAVAVANIAVFVDCRLAYLTQGDEDRRLDLVFGESDAGGSGVGCVDADGDGRSELVTLRFERNGPVVRWRRTILNIDGTIAKTGPTDEGTFRSPRDDDKIALLSEVTCGDNPLDAELGA